MLHKSKLQAALNLKRGQFNAFDDSFSDQLNAYRYALETLYTRYPSSTHLEYRLPPGKIGMPSAGALPTIEYDRWLAHAALGDYHGPKFSFGRGFEYLEQALQWSECIEGITTIA